MTQNLNRPETSGWLPTSAKEMKALGWDAADVILFTGDAYVDHPSFGAAVIGRILEAAGLRVAIVPQPNWTDDLRDFKKLGEPRLFFGVTAGNMDSMVNHYTANRRRRSNDAYTPGGRAGARPDYASVVYTNILKKLYPDIPVVLGGIEASLRRLTHYDYWSDKLKPGILEESGADLLFYGMAEKSISEFARLVQRGVPVQSLTNIPQTAFMNPEGESYATKVDWEALEINAHEECLKDKKKFAANFRYIEEESNRWQANKLVQQVGRRQIVVNPPWPPLSTKEIDQVYDLPFTRLPHPRYNGKGAIPAYEMIRHSINIHRGCFGGCSFCTISAHQGKFVVSRSEKSVMKEVEAVVDMPDFKGYISDVGGPSANMYRMAGKDLELCRQCKRPSCIYPSVCKNLETDHRTLTGLYQKVASFPGVKKAFIGSGIRYDLAFHETGGAKKDEGNLEYLREVIRHHVSGRLKVAPEHTSDDVLNVMRKPSFELFRRLTTFFHSVNRKEGLKQQLIPYFISSHPGSKLEDMAELAAETKELDFKLEQVQDFTPTPMTVATVIYYSGYHPYTLEKVFVPKTEKEKLGQRKFFFWYKKEYRNSLMQELQRLNRPDLEKRLFDAEQQPAGNKRNQSKRKKPKHHKRR